MVHAGQEFLRENDNRLVIKIDDSLSVTLRVTDKVGSPWKVELLNENYNYHISIDFGNYLHCYESVNVSIFVSVPAIKIKTNLLPTFVHERLQQIEQIPKNSFPSNFNSNDVTAVCLHRAHSENFKVRVGKLL